MEDRDDVSFNLVLEELTEIIKEAITIGKSYSQVRQELVDEYERHEVIEKKVFRYYLDKIAIKLLGFEVAVKEIATDETRMVLKGQEATYSKNPFWLN